jgi:hypothetical protein
VIGSRRMALSDRAMSEAALSSEVVGAWTTSSMKRAVMLLMRDKKSEVGLEL